MVGKTNGFTLIELLIATVIIALLVAIALPSFNSTKVKAYDATALADLHHLVEASEAYFADNLQYPTALADLTDWAPSNGVVVTEFEGNVTEVHIHLGHQDSDHYFHTRYPTDEIEKRQK